MGHFKKKKKGRQLKIQIQLSVGLHVQECGTVYGIFFSLTYSHTSWDCVKTGPAYSWQTVKSRIETLESGVKFFK